MRLLSTQWSGSDELTNLTLSVVIIAALRDYSTVDRGLNATVGCIFVVYTYIMVGHCGFTVCYTRDGGTTVEDTTDLLACTVHGGLERLAYM